MRVVSRDGGDVARSFRRDGAIVRALGSGPPKVNAALNCGELTSGGLAGSIATSGGWSRAGVVARECGRLRAGEVARECARLRVGVRAVGVVAVLELGLVRSRRRVGLGVKWLWPEGGGPCSAILRLEADHPRVQASQEAPASEASALGLGGSSWTMRNPGPERALTADLGS